MVEVIIMPKLGMSMDEGQLVKWCKKAGESVHRGEILFEILTDKTAMGLEATRDGVLLKTLLEEGAVAPVFTPIAVLGNPGENPDDALAAFRNASTQQSSVPVQETPAVAKSPSTAEVPDASKEIKKLKLTPKARKLIHDEAIDLDFITGIVGTGFEGGITAKDIKAASLARGLKDIKASPLAGRLADKAGVELASVEGTGPRDKIMKDDVVLAARISRTAAGPISEASDVLVASSAPYEGVRKIIGERLAQSKFTAPHLYFTDSVDTTELLALRKRINEGSGPKVTVSDLLIKAVSNTLREFPDMNAALLGDRIVLYESINVGLAVGGGSNGLIVPVVKNTQMKTLSAIAKESRELVERARSGTLASNEYKGGTFTISNLGMFGIENFTAILNPPEVGILAVSAIRNTPIAVTSENGEDYVAIRPMMRIQLSVDHRVIDGLLAAQFVGHLKMLLEHPVRILL